MESQNNMSQANTIASLLAIIGVLFSTAATFGLIAWRYALFGSAACFLLAPVVRKIISSQEKA